MTKNGLFATSFVAALPGAGMAYLMVMAFLNYSGGASMWTKALAGIMLLIGGMLAVMPVGIILFAGPKTEKKAPKKAKAKSDDPGEAELVEAEDDDGDLVAADDDGELVEAEGDEALLEVDDEAADEVVATDDGLEVFDDGADEFAMTGEIVDDSSGVSSGEFDLGEDFDSAEEDLLEIDDDEPP